MEGKIFVYESIDFLFFWYFNFGFKVVWVNFCMIWFIIWYVCRKKIIYLYVWCIFVGMNVYIVLKLIGVKLVFDSYELYVDFMVENYVWKVGLLVFWILFVFEKL